MDNEQLIHEVRKKYIDFFHHEPLIINSPGRVNLIGEHTDYNEGFVLPAAIDKGVVTAIGKRKDDEIHLHSIEFDELYITSLDSIAREPGSWTNYVMGVVAQLVESGFIFSGFNLVVGGNVPIGAGMSSSAAMECSVAGALNLLFDLSIPPLKMAKLAQKAEHEFAGVQCGIMDQFASVFGRRDHTIKLDCRTMQFEYLPLDLHGYKIVLFNTNVKHSLANTAYNKRRIECEKGVSWVRERYDVKSLRDVNLSMLKELVEPRDPEIFKRCRYVVEENTRLLEACEDLKNGDIISLGQKMFETHKGLSEDYEVSCIELDFLVNAVKNNPAVAGARMMGGGFGGCTINIIQENSIKQVAEELARLYEEKMGLKLDHYIAETADGTREIAYTPEILK